MEQGLVTRTEAGVPQGAGISPLLANVYLHEFDVWAEQQWELPRAERLKRRTSGHGNYRLIRFADDFCVVSNDRIAGVREAKAKIKQFLANELHLELSDDKTQITHVNDGFDFLGFSIQRVRPTGRWVVHLRPTAEATARVKAKIKRLTTRAWGWLDEHTRLTTLNWAVRNWANYYRFTSLQTDIEDVTRYTWHRYLRWLRKKHTGSRSGQLIKAKTGRLHGRTRWVAEIRQGGTTLRAYQWLATRTEFPRRRYPQKGRAGFAHPYLPDGVSATVDYPLGETGPDEQLYALAIGVPSRDPKRHEPHHMVERELRAKMRDGFACTRCGTQSTSLHVHHRRGTRSHRLRDLVTLCATCHKTIHYGQRR